MMDIIEDLILSCLLVRLKTKQWIVETVHPDLLELITSFLSAFATILLIMTIIGVLTNGYS